MPHFLLNVNSGQPREVQPNCRNFFHGSFLSPLLTKIWQDFLNVKYLWSKIQFKTFAKLLRAAWFTSKIESELKSKAQSVDPDFNQVMSALTTLTMTLTLSQVKTTLQKRLGQVRPSKVDRVGVIIRSLRIDIAKASQFLIALTTLLLQSNKHCRNCQQENLTNSDNLFVFVFVFFLDKREVIKETLIESNSGEL